MLTRTISVQLRMKCICGRRTSFFFKAISRQCLLQIGQCSCFSSSAVLCSRSEKQTVEGRAERGSPWCFSRHKPHQPCPHLSWREALQVCVQRLCQHGRKGGWEFACTPPPHGSWGPLTLTVFLCSGSMEPAFHRGDLLFLTNFREDPIRAGEIVVFKVEGRDIPIVHRVIKVHEK